MTKNKIYSLVIIFGVTAVVGYVLSVFVLKSSDSVGVAVFGGVGAVIGHLFSDKIQNKKQK